MSWHSIPILTKATADERPPYTVHVLADVPALALRAGMALDMRAQTSVDCDALYHMADGSFARIQFWQPGTMRVVRDCGKVEVMPIRAVVDRVQGYWTGRAALGQTHQINQPS